MKYLQKLRSIYFYIQLTAEARKERNIDHLGLPADDPGVERAIDTAVQWLCLAQDRSLTHDGGVARHFSLITGWGASYPETTGYIIPTLIAHARSLTDEELRSRARRMLDWLVSIQLPDGSFQGGTIDARPVVPVAFNTGQILLGLASGVREFGEEYLEPMRRAADWLVDRQNSNGSWRSYVSPFDLDGIKTYEPHLSWGLLEAASILPHRSYEDAALSNVRWALGFQHANGWFDLCDLTEPNEPLTHTLGYVLRGILEAYLFTGSAELLQSSVRTANGLLSAFREDGFLPGRLDKHWRGTVPWVCLTGTVQIAYCWLKLYQLTGDTRYRDAGYAANTYVRRTMKINGPPEIRGGIKSAFPVDGDYIPYNYLNWACKFFIDSNMLEKKLRNCLTPISEWLILLEAVLESTDSLWAFCC